MLPGGVDDSVPVLHRSVRFSCRGTLVTVRSCRGPVPMATPCPKGTTATPTSYVGFLSVGLEDVLILSPARRWGPTRCAAPRGFAHALPGRPTRRSEFKPSRDHRTGKAHWAFHPFIARGEARGRPWPVGRPARTAPESAHDAPDLELALAGSPGTPGVASAWLSLL